MTEILRTPVADRSAWRGRDLARERSWIVELSAAQADAMARGDFGPVEEVIAVAREEVLRGRGFVLLRGLPVEGRDRGAVRDMYWEFGRRLGDAIPQNLAGDLVNEIKDHGLDVNALNVKPSQTSAEQRPHTDPADIVTLLCINPARSGGLSRIASTMAIYNELLDKHPQYLEWLYRGFHHDLRGDASEAAPYGCTPRPIPVYRYFGGLLSCVFNASTIKDSQRRMGALVPEAEMKAIDTMVALARGDELRLDMDFRVGDLQILNNYTVLHWRTGFQDNPDPEKKRLLYRLWLNAPDARSVDPEMAAGYITGSKVVEAISTHA